MDDMNMDDMNMDDGNTSEMTMTFASWSVYKLKILFDSWDVETKWEFALSWIAVFFFTIVYHAVRYFIYTVEDFMDPNPSVNPLTAEQIHKGYQAASDGDCCEEEKSFDTSSSKRIQKVIGMSAWRYFWFRILHAILSGLNYGIALMLMLIAMTYNPSLFLALIIGYCTGDFIFYSQMRPFNNSECH